MKLSELIVLPIKTESALASHVSNKYMAINFTEPQGKTITNVILAGRNTVGPRGMIEPLFYRSAQVSAPVAQPRPQETHLEYVVYDLGPKKFIFGTDSSFQVWFRNPALGDTMSAYLMYQEVLED